MGRILQLLAVAAAVALALPGAAHGYITVQGTNFLDEQCRPFVFSGYNTWQILETAGGVCCGGRPSVLTQLDDAQQANLTVVRMFAYGVSPNYQLQETPGQYNESALQDFDYVISEAGKRNLRLIIALSSNWIYSTNTSGTKCWYTNYTTTANNCDQFFSDPNAQQLYKDWVKYIAARKNTITNVTYGSDPTIFAWDLMNEGRCDNPNDCNAADIQGWIQTVAPYVKSQVKQLVTVGEDGFLQASDCLSDKINPVTNNIGWPLQTGQDYLPNHAVNGIDFGAIHFWPDNWARVDTTFGMNWLDGHANLTSAVLKKPMIVEEFGKAFGGDTLTTGQNQTQAQQTAYYQLVYGIVQNSIQNSGIIKGIAFWRWAQAASPANSLAPFDNAATIANSSATYTQVIAPFSQFVAQNSGSGSAVSGCTPSSGSAPASSSGSAPSTESSSTSTTGRRLKQAPAAGPSATTAANINSQIPASLCSAYPPQPSNVG